VTRPYGLPPDTSTIDAGPHATVGAEVPTSELAEMAPALNARVRRLELEIARLRGENSRRRKDQRANTLPILDGLS
jgi:hypothetical protein